MSEREAGGGWKPCEELPGWLTKRVVFGKKMGVAIWNGKAGQERRGRAVSVALGGGAEAMTILREWVAAL